MTEKATCTEAGVETRICKGEGCTEKETREIKALGHKFVEKVGEKFLKSAATEESPAVYYKSCEVCGEKGEETFTDGDPLPPAHTHSYSTDWKSNADNHWHECECGEKADVAEHDFVSNNDDTNHWKECSVCGYKTEEVAHVYGDSQVKDGQVIKVCECGASKVVDDAVAVGTGEALKDAINEGKMIYLENDIEVVRAENLYFTFSKDACINLNEHTLTLHNPIYLVGGENEFDVVFYDGKLVMDVSLETGAYKDSDGNSTTLGLDRNAVNVEKNGTFSLVGVELTSNIGGLFAVNNEDNSTINVLGSKVYASGYYGIGTNASAPESINVVIKIVGSEVVVEKNDRNGGDTTGLLFNVKGHVEITNSTIKAHRHAVILRGGEGHKISKSTLVSTGDNSIVEEYVDVTWKAGNEVPLAALVIGNRHNKSYQYKTSVELDDVTIEAPEKNKKNKGYFAIYVYQNDATNTVSVSGTVKFAETNNKVNSEKNSAAYKVNE